ncbi:MAG: DUF5990 family protein, partial [Acidobacteriota bacterium]
NFKIRMKHEVPFRIIVAAPPPGVDLRMQKGRFELMPPVHNNAYGQSFDFSLDVDVSTGSPNFLGQFAQGPKDKRFVYINSGTYAGQCDSCWSRRAKVPLMTITTEQIDAVLASPGSLIEARIDGTGRDGGPVCASIKQFAKPWTVVQK